MKALARIFWIVSISVTPQLTGCLGLSVGGETAAVEGRAAAARAIDAAPSAGEPSEKPRAGRDAHERKLAIAELKVEQATMEAAAQETEAAAAIEHAKKELEIATGKLAQFREVDGPNRISQATLNLQQAKNAAEEAVEELQQIEIMYEEQDLEDRTAEFVVKRGKRNAELRKRKIAIEERALRGLEEREIPRELAALELDVAKKRAALEKAERDAGAGRLLKTIAKMTAQAEVADLKKKLADLDENAAKADGPGEKE